jgi:hypothetical protein
MHKTGEMTAGRRINSRNQLAEEAGHSGKLLVDNRSQVGVSMEQNHDWIWSVLPKALHTTSLARSLYASWFGCDHHRISLRVPLAEAICALDNLYDEAILT